MACLKLSAWLLLGVLLVLAGAGVALMSVDPAMFRGQLEAGVQRPSAGRLSWAGRSASTAR